MSTFMSISVYAVGVLVGLVLVSTAFIAVANWLVKNTQDNGSTH